MGQHRIKAYRTQRRMKAIREEMRLTTERARIFSRSNISLAVERAFR